MTAESIRVGNQPAIELKTIRSFDRLAERVLIDLDRHAYSWGKPPDNFYWVPAVRFLVRSGGNHYFERLQAPLRRWGISSTVEYPREMPVFPKREE